ncbi:MAG: glycosyltransferase family 4 protein [Acidimicrobiales bacterium]
MSRTQLLFVAEHLRGRVPGGIGTYARGLLQGLAALGPDGPDVTLWASRGDPPAGLAGPAVTSPLPGKALVWGWDRGWFPPPKGFEAVHAPSLAAPPAGDTPLAVTVHDLAWRRFPETFPARGRRWHEAALGRAVGRAAALVTPSQQTADDLLAAGAPAERVEVVEEGVDHLPVPDHAGATRLLARLGVRDGYLLTASTLEPRKNLARLVAAYAAARPRLPEPWPLVVAGPAGWGPSLAPGEGVLLAGNLDLGVLTGLYSRARVVASVPLFEGFGLPAVEAMACGAPVLASRQPSIGAAAYVVDPLDADAIATGLARLATDEALRSDLVAAGHARAAELTWANAAARHAEIWSSLRRPSGRHVQP